MKWKKFLLFIPLITLVGCKGNSEITTKCPLGAPSLVFYDQGNNSNFVTISGAAQIVAEFQQNKYDALVVDATSGLRQIKNNPDTPFRLAKLLTSGNLYIISFKHSEYPSTGKTLISFGNNTSIPYYVTEALNANWKVKADDLNYKNDVSEVLRLAKLDTSDYYIIAEPALTNLDKTSLKLNERLSIPNAKIPQAALFINKNSYNKKKDKFTKYLTDLDTRIDNCINHPEIFKTSLDKYGDDSTVSQRFGFKSSVAFSVQQYNGFAFTKDSFTYIDMNNFMSKVGHSEIQYDGSEFL